LSVRHGTLLKKINQEARSRTGNRKMLQIFNNERVQPGFFGL